MFKHLLLSCCALLAAFTLFVGQATAADIEAGSKIFAQNCAACHAGGTNRVNAAKTLKKDALQKYDMYSEDKIVYQVTKGKMAMPAFGGRLSDDQIASVAAYVLDRADKGW